MRKRMVSICCAVALVVSMLIVPGKTVQAEDAKVLDGSYLTYEDEAIGYDTKITRGEDLQTGYSKIVRLGAGKIYAGGTTLAHHDCEIVRIGVMVERAKKDDDSWTFYDGWQAEEKNTDRIASAKALAVDGDYYYRVRCFHSANDDVSSSFTNGIYIEKP